MIECRYCGDENLIKAGFIGNTQRYHCKGCKRHYQFANDEYLYDGSVKEAVAEMRLKGDSYKKIKQFSGASESSVRRWMKEYLKKHKRDLEGRLMKLKATPIPCEEVRAYAEHYAISEYNCFMVVQNKETGEVEELTTVIFPEGRQSVRYNRGKWLPPQQWDFN
ncbi:MAG: hypothetical protein P8P30_01940 [Rickettsiales bacterium]|nr:hypothetical protein [Rickettsiales bacterium]